MKRADLLQSLEIAKPCLSNNALIPMLSHYCFDGNCLMTFNGAQGVITTVESDLQCCIPGDLFYKLVESYPVDEIDIKQKKESVWLNVKGNVAKLAILPKEDYIFDAPNVEGLTEVELTKDFFKGLERCLMSVSDNPMHRNMFGITIINTGERTCLYATNIDTLSKYELEKPLHEDAFQLLLPKLYCALLIILGKAYEEAILYLGDNYVYADFGDTGVYSKIMSDVEFLEFEREINYYFEENMTFQERPVELLGGLSRCLIVLSESVDKFVNVTVAGNNLTLVAETPMGNIKEDVTLEVKQTLKFKMDASLLEKGLLATEQFTFVQKGAEVAFIGQENKFIHIVLSPNEE